MRTSTVLIISLILLTAATAAQAQLSDPENLSDSNNNEGLNSGVDVAWGKVSFGVAWARGGLLYYCQVDENGWPMMEKENVAFHPGDISNVSIHWANRHFIIVFTAEILGTKHIYVQRVRANGSAIGDPVQITEDGEELTGAPAAVWGKNRLLIAYPKEAHGSTALQCVAVRKNATIRKRKEVLVHGSNLNFLRLAVAFNGNEFAVVMQLIAENTTDYLQMIRVRANLSTIGQPLYVHAENNLINSLAMSEGANKGWLVVFHTRRAGTYICFAGRFRRNLRPIEDFYQLNSHQTDALNPDVDWDPLQNRFYTVWSENEGNGDYDLWGRELRPNGKKRGDSDSFYAGTERSEHFPVMVSNGDTAMFAYLVNFGTNVNPRYQVFVRRLIVE